MFEIGQKIYFRREGDGRLLKGTIIRQAGDSWIIRGARRANQFNPPEYTVPSGVIVTDHVKHRDKVKKLETGHGSGLSIVASESIRRQAIVTARLGMTEMQVLQARAMLEIRRRTIRALASSNRITTSNPDFDELSSEYVVAQLTALRATAASATDADIKDFKRYLDDQTADSRIMMTITRTSRTAAIRYLKRRSQYHQLHANIDDIAYRLAA